MPSRPVNHTRYANTRRGIISPKRSKKRRLTQAPISQASDDHTPLATIPISVSERREASEDFSSEESERVFSGVKHTVSDQRNSLKSTIIELLKYLKSLFRLGIFTEQDLHAIVGNLNEEGAMEALEAENQ